MPPRGPDQPITAGARDPGHLLPARHQDPAGHPRPAQHADVTVLNIGQGEAIAAIASSTWPPVRWQTEPQ
jgi:hypothetical protein